MKRALILMAVLLVLSVTSAAEKSYLLELEYFQRDLELNELYIEEIKPDESIEEDELSSMVVIIGENETELYRHFFYLNNEIFVDQITEDGLTGGVVELEDFEFSLALPFSEEGEKIAIFDANGNKKLEVDIKAISEYIEPIQTVETGEPPAEPSQLEAAQEKPEPVQDNMPIALASGGLGFVLVGFVAVQYWKERKREF